MNLIFVTQSTGLRIFWRMMEAIRRQGALDHAGFSVADHYQYLKIAEEFPEFESGHFSLVKEWEITQTAPQTRSRS